MKLDRKKPFGVIFGEADGAVYEQDGKHFDSDENEIVLAEDQKQTAKKAATSKSTSKSTSKAAAKNDGEPSGDPVDEQLAAQGAV